MAKQKITVYFSDKLSVTSINDGEHIIDIKTITYDRPWLLGEMLINMDKVCFIRFERE